MASLGSGGGNYQHYHPLQVVTLPVSSTRDPSHQAEGAFHDFWGSGERVSWKQPPALQLLKFIWATMLRHFDTIIFYSLCFLFIGLANLLLIVNSFKGSKIL